ncbi:MAG TPA: hypothetical protein DCE42_30575 [Myxococcales bacterium]|nr:hypothetical protein [Deltaproteobacteria bacterium]HAA59134.1 hypothetical protein [Myxococcales bacterium]|tara:strand:- start:13568 stop:14014 length:447 start_codon:yes stop_codon:yes gene_type:complete
MSWNPDQPDRRKNRSNVPSEAVKKQLEAIAQDGRLKAALLADEDGLTVVNIESDHDTESFAALAGFLWNTSKEIESVAGLTKIDQLTLTDPEGDTIICRFFELLGQPVVLGVIAADGDDSRRPFTDRAIAGIKRIFAQAQEDAQQGDV